MYPRTNGGVGAAPVDGNRGRRCKPYRSGSATVRVPDDRSLIDLGAGSHASTTQNYAPKAAAFEQRGRRGLNSGPVAPPCQCMRTRGSSAQPGLGLAAFQCRPRQADEQNLRSGREFAGSGRLHARHCRIGRGSAGVTCRRRLCVYIDRAAGIGRCLRTHRTRAVVLNRWPLRPALSPRRPCHHALLGPGEGVTDR